MARKILIATFPVLSFTICRSDWK